MGYYLLKTHRTQLVQLHKMEDTTYSQLFLLWLRVRWSRIIIFFLKA